MEVNGTVEGAQDIAIEDEGELYIWSHANSHGHSQGVIQAINISVRAGGKFEPLTAHDGPRMELRTTRLTVNGFGYIRVNDIHIRTGNLTVDVGGELMT